MTAPSSPYVGLRPYTEEYAAYFFGRDRDARVIVANLRARRLTLVYGESGVGKSSLLQAAVLSQLKQLARETLGKEAKPNLAVTFFGSWRDEPAVRLANAVHDSLVELLGTQAGDRVPSSTPLAAALAEYSARLGGTIHVILDQFEEYLAYHGADGGGEPFADQFPAILDEPALRVRFLISIREDALAKLDRFRGRIPHLFDSSLRISPLSRRAGRAAILEPLHRFNADHGHGQPFSIEPVLVEAVLDQVGAGKVVLEQFGGGAVEEGVGTGEEAPIEAPYLQVVMSRLWEEERRLSSRTLRLATLEALGGAERIVRTRLDQVLDRLPEAEQGLAADLFHHLVTPGGTKVAHTSADLAGYLGRREADVLPVLERLSGAELRILRPVAPPLDEPETRRYEIFHDVLAAAVLDWRARFARVRLERQRHEAESRARRERRKVRLFRGLAAAFLLLAAALAVVALVQRNEARGKSRDARSGELAARALSAADDDPRIGLALAVDAADVRRTPAAVQALKVSFQASSARAVLRGHANWVNTARWSPDGRYVVTASDDRTAKIWDSRSGRLVTTLAGHTGFVNVANWSADGTRVVTAGDSTARIWRWRSEAKPLVLRVGRPDKDCAETSTCVTVAQFGGAKGEYVLTASFDDVVRVWDAQRGRVVWRKAVDSLHTAAFDASGTRVIVTNGLEAAIYDWQRPKAKPVSINRPGSTGHRTQTDTLQSVVFSRDGRYLVTGSEDKTIAVWDARTGDNLAQLYGPRVGVLGVDISPSDVYVAAGSRDGAIYLFDWRAETRIAKLVGPSDLVSDVSFKPDGEMLASASGDRTAWLWAMPSVLTLAHAQPVEWATWSPDGTLVTTATTDCAAEPEFRCKALLWDAKRGRVVRTLLGHTDWVTGTAFSPDGRFLATSSDDRTARVWSVRSGNQLAVLQGHTDWVNSVGFSPDGRLIATASLDGTARIWMWRTHKAVATIHGTDSVGSASFDPTGRYLLTTGGTPHDYTARIWDWRRSGRSAYRVLRGHSGAVNNASWSPDGRYVVTASSDRTVRVWDWRAARQVRRLTGGLAARWKDAAFSPNGKLIAAGSEGGSVVVWDWRRTSVVAQPRFHLDAVNSVQFSPDSRSLLTASDDWTADVYDCTICRLSTSAILAVARTYVQRTVLPEEVDSLLP